MQLSPQAFPVVHTRQQVGGGVGGVVGGDVIWATQQAVVVTTPLIAPPPSAPCSIPNAATFASIFLNHDAHLS